MAQYGFIPAMASPAENVTAYCSAIPTSKNLSGNFSAKLLSPVPSPIAAVIAAILLYFSAIDNIFLPKTSVHDKASHLFFAAPVSLSKAETPWKTSGLFSAGT